MKTISVYFDDYNFRVISKVLQHNAEFYQQRANQMTKVITPCWKRQAYDVNMDMCMYVEHISRYNI